jgi:hypothetical protein
MQDRGYDVRGGGFMETVLQDVRYGVRLLVRHRGFSTIAILTLAVGIGASTALFSVIEAALLRPLPYPHPEQMVDVMVGETFRGESSTFAPSPADIRAWRESGRIFAHVGAGRVTGFVPRVVDAGVPERVIVGDLSEDFLEVFGVKPLLGRSVQIEDVRKGAPAVVLLGGSGPKSTCEGRPMPVTLQEVEQCGRAVLLPQACLGFPPMPGECFCDRCGEVGGVTGPQSLQDSALIGRLDADQTVRGIHSLCGEQLGQQDQILRRSRIRGRQGPDLDRTVVAGRRQPTAVRTEG